MRTLRMGSFKVIVTPRLERQEAFNLVEDPGETHSLKLEPETEEEFRKLFDTIENLNTEIRKRISSGDEGDAEDLREKLKALGYLG